MTGSRLTSRAALAAVALIAAAIAAGPAGAQGLRARAGSYVGTPSRGGTVEFAVASDGRTIPRFSVVDGVAPRHTSCSHYGTTVGPFHIGASGRFFGNDEGDIGMVVRGRVSRAGLVTGHVSYADRGGCFAADRFVARRVRGLVRSGPRLLNLYGGDGAPAGLPRVLGGAPPATRAGTYALATTQQPDGSLVVADADSSSFAGLFSVSVAGRARRLGGGADDHPAGNGGPVSAARFSTPDGLAALPDGGYLVADAGTACVRRVSPAGTITDAAGVCATEPAPAGVPSGDGGPATKAHLSSPDGLALLPDGGFLIADPDADRVREVTPDGIISTVAGDGRGGFSGDGGPATAARLSDPQDVAVLPDGGFAIADSGNGRVREVAPDGTITTVAGGGRTTLARGIGDGGPATRASLATPAAVAVAPGGGLLVADSGTGLVREVASDGTISTIAGGGALGPPAAGPDASLSYPEGLETLSDGGVAIVDQGEIDELAPATTPRLLTALDRSAVTVGAGRAVRLTLTATHPARLTIVVTRVRHRHRLTVTRTTAGARAGRTPLRVGGLAAGRYRLRVTATAGPRVATASASVRVR